MRPYANFSSTVVLYVACMLSALCMAPACGSAPATKVAAPDAASSSTVNVDGNDVTVTQNLTWTNNGQTYQAQDAIIFWGFDFSFDPNSPAILVLSDAPGACQQLQTLNTLSSNQVFVHLQNPTQFDERGTYTVAANDANAMTASIFATSLSTTGTPPDVAQDQAFSQYAEGSVVLTERIGSYLVTSGTISGSQGTGLVSQNGNVTNSTVTNDTINGSFQATWCTALAAYQLP